MSTRFNASCKIYKKYGHKACDCYIQDSNNICCNPANMSHENKQILSAMYVCEFSIEDAMD